VTALTAAGGGPLEAGTSGCGTAPWDIKADPRIKAVMGLAIGAAPITFCTDFANVTAPTLLVAGLLDANSTPAISEAARRRIATDKKSLIYLENAVHRSFDSTYCAQMQAAGAVAQVRLPDGTIATNPRAILDKHTVDRIVEPNTTKSGVATDYCSLASFTTPVDITPLVRSITGFDFDTQQVPSTGLDTETVKQWITDRAVTFFRGVFYTPPVIRYSIYGALGMSGWYVSDVAVN